jgi:Spy/CpxP family protein refolding chaperone
MRTSFLILMLATGLSAQNVPQTSSAPTSRASRHEALSSLHLTEAQKGQIKAIRAKHQEALQAKRASLREAQQSLRAAMKDAKSPESDLRNLHAQAADRHFNLILERRAMRQEMGALLTPEQREKAAELRGRMAERLRARRALSGREQAG